MTQEAEAPFDDGSPHVSVAHLGENEAALIDAFVVPGYLGHFWELARPLLLVGEASRVVHLGCRTGYPDGELLAQMPNTTGVGVDVSLPCLAVAGAKMDAFGFDYLHALPEATPLAGQTFSHALTLHPLGRSEARQALFREMARLVYPGGQILVSLPLSSSFPQIVDLLAEFALKFDSAEMALLVEALATGVATEEGIRSELAAAGLSDFSFERGELRLPIDSGRALLEDPACRFFVFPQISDWLDGEDLSQAMAYVAKAVDKYWSDERLELEVKMLAVSARR